ncbi:major facilitator superfamily domain-containing protein [Tribonema minus]|uniref:Major facilitator superfamily domain-containing protein n=1 Tax=Tribonema minus TaxID=303371 RepID=A0A836CD83_9STRA|nr:major facilitator superfamily domain-containing protein [Tribonema minus]
MRRGRRRGQGLWLALCMHCAKSKHQLPPQQQQQHHARECPTALAAAAAAWRHSAPPAWHRLSGGASDAGEAGAEAGAIAVRRRSNGGHSAGSGREGGGGSSGSSSSGSSSSGGGSESEESESPAAAAVAVPPPPRAPHAQKVAVTAAPAAWGGLQQQQQPPPLPLQRRSGDGAAGEGALAGSSSSSSSWSVLGRAALAWRPKYIIVKVLFLLYYASLGVVMPYLPVYYHSLGHGNRRIGHLGAITPAVTFFVSPLWGALTDSTGRLKEVLLFTFAASVVFRVLTITRETYPFLVSIIALTAAVNAPVKTLLDSSVLNLLDDKREYGKQRLWGQCGFGLGSYLIGVVMARHGLTYKAAFKIHAAISAPTLLILLRFRPKAMPREPPRFREGLRVIAGNRDMVAFFALIFAIGVSSGVIENFAYKRLAQLGAEKRVLGKLRLLSSVAGIPMFWVSGNMTRYVSVEGVLLLTLAGFVARFVIYAAVTDPLHALPAEVLRGVCFAGFWAAATGHTHRIAPPGLGTTMLGFLQGIYGGIGQSLGSLLGGSLSGRIGTARTFFVYAGVDTVLLVLFCIYFASTKPSAAAPAAAATAVPAPAKLKLQ